MRKFSLYLIYIVVATMVCATLFSRCGQRVHNPLLLRAENLVIDNPDSALSILEKLRPAVWTDGKDTTLFSLVWAEAYYMKNKALNDSIIRFISRRDESMDEEHRLINDILYAKYLHSIGDVEKAFLVFDSCSHTMNFQYIHPFWSCMVNDNLGWLYGIHGLNDLAKEYFCKSLTIAQKIGNERIIAQEYCNLSCNYAELQHFDSAIYCITQILQKDSVLIRYHELLSIAQHNLSLIQMYAGTAHFTDIMNGLKSSINNKMLSVDSMITYSLIAQVYYQNNDVDSGRYYQQQIEASNHNTAKRLMYVSLSEYYKRLEIADSAYKYMLLRDSLQSIDTCSYSPNSIAYTSKQNLQKDTNTKVGMYMRRIRVLFIAIILLFFVLIVYKLHYRKKSQKEYSQREQLKTQVDNKNRHITQLKSQLDHNAQIIDKQKSKLSQQTSYLDKQSTKITQQNQQIDQLSTEMKKLADELQISQTKTMLLNKELCEREIAIKEAVGIQEQMSHDLKAMKQSVNDNQQELNATINVLNDTKSQLNEITISLVKANNIIEKHQSTIAWQNKELKKARRENNLPVEHCRIIIDNFLNPNESLQHKMTSSEMLSVVKAYSTCGVDKADFIQAMKCLFDEKSIAYIIICILYYENFTDKDIIQKMGYSPGAFRTARSRVLARINESELKQSHIFQQLLRKFHYKN